MATNTKVTDLTVLNATPDSGDIFYLTDVSDTTDGAAGTSKQITRTNTIGGLATSGANSNITSLTGLTTPLTVAQGGTGAATLTGILLGAGTSAVTALSSSGTGNVVRVAGATLTTPTLGVALATSLNGLVVTTTTGTITLTNAKTLTISDSTTLATDSITFAGAEVLTLTATKNVTFANTFITSGAFSLTLTTTAATSITLPTTGTLSTLAGAETLSNKRRTRRVVTVTQSATPATNSDTTDVASITALAQAITSMSSSLTGTPVDGDLLEFRITDNGTARAITWGSTFAATTVALPITTVISTMLRVLFEYSGSTWQCLASV